MNKFNQHGTFDCRICGHHTRDTGDNGCVSLCSDCYELSGIENAFQDGNDVWAEGANQYAEKIAKKTGKNVLELFPFLNQIKK